LKRFLRIINEFDRDQEGNIGRNDQAEPYMATRYLQTQHRNRQGKTRAMGGVSGMVASGTAN